MAYLPIHLAPFCSEVCSIQILHILFALHVGISCFQVLLKQFFFSFNCSLPVYKHIIDFCILIMYPVILINSLILVFFFFCGGGQTLEFSTLIVMLSVKRDSFIFSFLLSMPRFCRWFKLLFHLEHFIFRKYFNKIKSLPNGLF